MKLPKLSIEAVRHAASHPALMGLAAVTWLGVSFNEPSKPMMIFAGFFAGICAAAVIYHSTIRRIISLGHRMSDALEMQQQAMQTLMTMKTGEIGKTIAEHVNGIVCTEVTITKH